MQAEPHVEKRVGVYCMYRSVEKKSIGQHTILRAIATFPESVLPMQKITNNFSWELGLIYKFKFFIRAPGGTKVSQFTPHKSHNATWQPTKKVETKSRSKLNIAY